MRGGPFRLRLAVSCDAGEGGCPAQLQRVTLGCAASEQVPGAGKGALTQYLEKKWGFTWGMGRLTAGAQARRECEVRGAWGPGWSVPFELIRE